MSTVFVLWRNPWLRWGLYLTVFSGLLLLFCYIQAADYVNLMNRHIIDNEGYQFSALVRKRLFEFDFVWNAGYYAGLVTWLLRELLAVIVAPQRSKQLRRSGIRVSLLLLLIGGWNTLLTPDPQRCDYFTKLIGGGSYQLKHGHYDIQLCSIGYFFEDSKILMRVYSVDSGIPRLVAKRIFYYSYIDSKLNYLSVNDREIYYDPNNSTKYDSYVALPPSWWDWLWARWPQA